ncbi:MAG: hypothetical protein AVDCRST_MAG20-1274 [uncultured Acidimicrobiales bacterium]|uniref:Uncharacterized protein n=1 Tax=uncultured Acidimicrobiales bacterium TaxID=310071 RepID=A0A6J4HSD0_9ACTN|nr:MAG: hypothetical protein AVDCRST_MAG20-1274 [uncultured Acidimicrobiales bacterium]
MVTDVASLELGEVVQVQLHEAAQHRFVAGLGGGHLDRWHEGTLRAGRPDSGSSIVSRSGWVPT